MKKILSLLLILTMCFSVCACSKNSENTVFDVDFSNTAGVWFFKGSPEAARLVMDGKGKVTSYYSEDMDLEFEGYLGYDTKNDTYAVFTDDDEYIGEFEFFSEMQINFIDSDDVRYTKSDEEISVSKLLSAYTPNSSVTVQNISFPNEKEDINTIEMYIVNCIAKVCDTDFDKISIKEAAEYRDKLGYQVYTVSWTTDNDDWDMFFFTTTTTTYIYSITAPHGTLSDDELADIYNSLYLE